MRIKFSQVIDAFANTNLALSYEIAPSSGVFSSVELFTGQHSTDDTLYIVDENASHLPDNGSFLVATKRDEPLTGYNCIIGATAQEAFNIMVGYLMRLTQCLDAMRERLYYYYDWQGFCQVFSDFVGNPVVITDSSYTPIAQTEFPQDFALRHFGSLKIDHDTMLRVVPDWKRQEGEDVFARTGARRLSDSEQKHTTALCNVLTYDEYRGYIEIFEVHKPITDGEMALLEEAARIASTAPFFFDKDGILLSHLYGRSIKGDLTASWLSALRWHKSDDIYVIAIDPPAAKRDDKLYIDHVIRWSRLIVPNSVSQLMGEMPIVVANNRFMKRDKAVSEMVAFLEKVGEGAHVGASEIMEGIEALHEGYAHAQFAARLKQENDKKNFVFFEECRFAFLSDLCKLQDNANLILDARIARMNADDIKNGSENLRTIKTYIETGLNLNATARILSVHRNTVAYRLHHIASAYGIDLSLSVSDSELIFQVLLSCKIICKDT